MSKGPPLRLRDDPEVARSLRTDLARAASQPVAYDVARGLSRFEAALQVGASAWAGGGTILGAALKGALLGVVVVGGATLVESRAPSTPHEATPPPAVTSMTRVEPAGSARAATPVTTPRPAVPPSPDTASPPRAPADAREPTPRPVATSLATVEAAPVPAASYEVGSPIGAADAPAPAGPAPAGKGDALAAEIEHLARLRALRDSDPAQALALAAEGARRFPAGLFVQEREAIAIGALVQLGRGAEARARATRFLEAYPRSAFAERIRALTGIGAP